MVSAIPTIKTTPLHAEGSLEVRLLGCVDFQAAKLLQEWQVQETSQRNDQQGTLILCEHPPVLTQGRTASFDDISFHHEQELVSRQIPTVRLNRGGGTLLHLPGQLAMYPIFPLARMGISPTEFNRRFGRAIVDSCCEQRIEADSIRSQSAIITVAEKRIATIGAAMRNGVCYHGAFLNVSPDLHTLRLIANNQESPDDTSIQAERVGPVRMDAVREAIVRNIAKQFGYQRQHIYTSHPFLKRTSRKVHAYA